MVKQATSAPTTPEAKAAGRPTAWLLRRPTAWLLRRNAVMPLLLYRRAVRCRAVVPSLLLGYAGSFVDGVMTHAAASPGSGQYYPTMIMTAKMSIIMTVIMTTTMTVIPVRQRLQAAVVDAAALRTRSHQMWTRPPGGQPYTVVQHCYGIVIHHQHSIARRPSIKTSLQPINADDNIPLSVQPSADTSSMRMCRCRHHSRALARTSPATQPRCAKNKKQKNIREGRGVAPGLGADKGSGRLRYADPK